MPQTEAFETDFWKHANLRKMWDDIIPGEPRKTVPYTDARRYRTLLRLGRRKPSNLYRRGIRQDHGLWRADRAARDPYSPDVCLHAGRRLDAQSRDGQCRPVMELQYSGASRR